MAFVIKKLLAILLLPLSLVGVLALIGAWYWWRGRLKAAKYWLLMAGGCLLALSLPPLPNLLLAPLELPYHSAVWPQQPIRQIVVLGGGVNADSALPASSQLSNATLHRLVEGIRAWRHYDAPYLILSGGSLWGGASEAQLMASVAQDLGVPAERLLLDNDSKDTEAQAEWLKQHLPLPEAFLLVTSANHMQRSLLWMQHHGLEALPWAAGFVVRQAPQWVWSEQGPRATNLAKAEVAWYEQLGLVWLRLKTSWAE